MGFIQNSRAVLLLAACRTSKSDRLLGKLIRGAGNQACNPRQEPGGAPVT